MQKKNTHFHSVDYSHTKLELVFKTLQHCLYFPSEPFFWGSPLWMYHHHSSFTIESQSILNFTQCRVRALQHCPENSHKKGSEAAAQNKRQPKGRREATGGDTMSWVSLGKNSEIQGEMSRVWEHKEGKERIKNKTKTKKKRRKDSIVYRKADEMQTVG